MKNRIQIDDKKDREALALILAKQGYAVQIIKEKLNQADKSAKWFIKWE